MTISYAEIEDLRANTDGTDKPQDPYSDASEINAQLSQLGPNDHVQLAALLRQYPDKQQTILYVAARQCGNACVQRALAMVQNGEGAQPSQADRDEAAQGFESTAPTVDATTASNAAALSAEVESSSMWKGADAYNAAHPHHVTEFNALTDGFAMRDGKVDAEKIANWQYDHGLDADGKIGPRTVAAAKKQAETRQASEPETSTQDNPDEQIDPTIDGSPWDRSTYE